MELFQRSNHRTLEEYMRAYGGIFVVSSIIWGLLIDKKKPDRYDVIGSFIVLSGAAVIF